jgi:hypothetical protein
MQYSLNTRINVKTQLQHSIFVNRLYVETAFIANSFYNLPVKYGERCFRNKLRRLFIRRLTVVHFLQVLVKLTIVDVCPFLITVCFIGMLVTTVLINTGFYTVCIAYRIKDSSNRAIKLCSQVIHVDFELLTVSY